MADGAQPAIEKEVIELASALVKEHPDLGVKVLDVWLNGEWPETELCVTFSVLPSHGHSPGASGIYGVREPVYEDGAAVSPSDTVWIYIYTNALAEDVSRHRLPAAPEEGICWLDDMWWTEPSR